MSIRLIKSESGGESEVFGNQYRYIFEHSASGDIRRVIAVTAIVGGRILNTGDANALAILYGRQIDPYSSQGSYLLTSRRGSMPINRIEAEGLAATLATNIVRNELGELPATGTSV